MKHIIPYTLHQNGVAKINNHTLKEMENCMIQSNGLIPPFLEESIHCAHYIVNPTPTET